MAQASYQQETLGGATGVELVVALYDATIRFLYKARECAEQGDAQGRRAAVKKVVDIVMYLQARLRTDVGGSPAISLSDFYAAMFTLTLEASHFNSPDRFTKVIECVRNVRDAWVVVARDPEAGKILPRELRTGEERFVAPSAATATAGDGAPSGSRWSA